nr:protein disulfide isomerase-like 1-4 [Tanacetum cinerariifolium]
MVLEYDATASEMNATGEESLGEEEMVMPAEADDQEGTELAKRYEVQGFSTVLWFVDGVYMPYLIPRTKPACYQEIYVFL